MSEFYYEFEVRKQFERLAAVDRQLTRWGWFRRHEGRPAERGWRSRAGKALIRLGHRLQDGEAARPTRTLGRL